MTTQYTSDSVTNNNANPIANNNPSSGVGPSQDLLEVTPLGAGSEVGRSCILLKFRGKTVLLDCGIHPAYTGLASLPFFDAIDNANKIDLLLISQYVLFYSFSLSTVVCVCVVMM
jgi:cleavage and polyadenylation specificity factor subunit 3